MNRKQLILEYWPLAKGIAYNTCYIPRLREECQSVAAEAMIMAIDNYDPSNTASLKTWITLKTKYSVINFVRRELKRHSCLDITDYVNSYELSSNNLEKQIKARDLLLKILCYLPICKKKRKNECDVLMAYCFEGLLQKEIAEYRGCSPANICYIIQQLKEAIFNKFGDEI